MKLKKSYWVVITSAVKIQTQSIIIISSEKGNRSLWTYHCLVVWIPWAPSIEQWEVDFQLSLCFFSFEGAGSHFQLKSNLTINWKHTDVCFCRWFGYILYDSIFPSSYPSTFHAWRKISLMYNGKNFGFHSDIRLKMRPFQTKMRPFRWRWEAGRVRELSTLAEQRASQSKLPVDWKTARFNWLLVFAEFQLKAVKIYSTGTMSFKVSGTFCRTNPSGSVCFADSRLRSRSLLLVWFFFFGVFQQHFVRKHAEVNPTTPDSSNKLTSEFGPNSVRHAWAVKKLPARQTRQKCFKIARIRTEFGWIVGPNSDRQPELSHRIRTDPSIWEFLTFLA